MRVGSNWFALNSALLQLYQELQRRGRLATVPVHRVPGTELRHCAALHYSAAARLVPGPLLARAAPALTTTAGLTSISARVNARECKVILV